MKTNNLDEIAKRRAEMEKLKADQTTRMLNHVSQQLAESEGRNRELQDALVRIVRRFV